MKETIVHMNLDEVVSEYTVDQEEGKFSVRLSPHFKRIVNNGPDVVVEGEVIRYSDAVKIDLLKAFARFLVNAS